MNSTRLEIGGMGILFRSRDYHIQENTSREEHHSKSFICSGNRNDLTMDIEIGSPPLYSKRHKLFEARENWRLFEDRERYIFETFQSDEKDGGTTGVCIMEKGLSKGKVYILPQSDYEAGCKGWSLEQVIRVLGHILVVSTIHRYQGMLIHASGVILNGEGIIFCGMSGAGKTTLSRLWQKRAGVTVLSDDRVIVRKEGKEYCLYGTPWPGEGGMAFSQKAPLTKLCFLFKDDENTLTGLKKKEALRQIITQCFPALWDRESIHFGMEFCGSLLEALPTFRFGFVPDQSAVEFIEHKFTHD
jgi:hypothetical protein